MKSIAVKSILSLAAVALLALPARADLPQPVRESARDWAAARGQQRTPEWRALGRGELRWFGLALYEARLWVSGERFDAGEPFALALTYARSIAGSRLAGTSMDEMRRLGWSDAAALGRWQEQLQRLFPDVRPGDTLVGVSLPGRGARFFHQGRALGEIDDPEFARAFFAIWLDPRTRAPQLRGQLLQQP